MPGNDFLIFLIFFKLDSATPHSRKHTELLGEKRVKAFFVVFQLLPVCVRVYVCVVSVCVCVCEWFQHVKPRMEATVT